ncbi:uncharacterized protein EV420DRAFT_1478488 [Desarmillaria tabescens]|uniref:Uncharacterized protein n=1 Tax=Armillaria tabescens TaxID=1929756 RepID=A0AA39N824_ARMTA|nr:uncharacterized protein EV420DRAFT_1478488 [Desarmillaria tabescens]KAK0460744.1 hypothetical protein EV420DRAFT_1478488 [Desarmillaria tabescens]
MQTAKDRDNTRQSGKTERSNNAVVGPEKSTPPSFHRTTPPTETQADRSFKRGIIHSQQVSPAGEIRHKCEPGQAGHQLLAPILLLYASTKQTLVPSPSSCKHPRKQWGEDIRNEEMHSSSSIGVYKSGSLNPVQVMKRPNGIAEGKCLRPSGGEDERVPKRQCWCKATIFNRGWSVHPA